MVLLFVLACPRAAAPVASVPVDDGIGRVANVFHALCGLLTDHRQYTRLHPNMAEWADPMWFGRLPRGPASQRVLEGIDDPAALMALREEFDLGSWGCEPADFDVLPLDRLLLRPLEHLPPCPEGAQAAYAGGVDACVLVSGEAIGAVTVELEGVGVPHGWVLESVGSSRVQSNFDQGRPVGSFTFDLDDRGRPYLRSELTNDPDGHMDTQSWFDEFGRPQVKVTYSGPHMEARRVTWLRAKPFAVRVAVAEGSGDDRMAREWVLQDGDRSEDDTWPMAFWVLDREHEAMRRQAGM